MDLTILLSILAVFLSILFWWLSPRRPPGLPPGPGPALPLLGHLHLIEKDPRAKFRQWRRQYGDVFSLYFGNRLVVVLSGYNVMKQALVKRGEAFSDRPHFPLVKYMTSSNGVLETNGPLWKAQRTVSLEILREFGLGKNLLAEKIQEEVSEYIKAMASKNGQPFDMTRLTQISVSNNICSIIFGKRFDYDDPEFKQLISVLEDFFESLGAGGVIALFPFLRHVPGDPFGAAKLINSVRTLCSTLIQPIIDKHLQDFDENNVDDFISAYIREIRSERKKSSSSFTNENNLTKLVLDLFAGGTETTSTTIRWLVVYLLHYPEEQEKCYQDVVKVVGHARPPSWKDRQEMPYLEATITEIMRVASLVPLGVPHATSCDVTIGDYLIPKDTFIITNLDSVMKDPEVWGDPEKFRPERFIGPDGKISRPEEFIPFSAGRRACLGESLARMELFLYMATMLQHFRFLPPEDGELPSLTGILGGVDTPKPFKVRAVTRH